MAQNTVQFELVGARELARMMESLPRKMSGPVVRKALREGGKVILAAAREKAPVGETGNLKKSMSPGRGIRVRTYRRIGVTVAIVGPSWPLGSHASWIEFGTAMRKTKDKKKRGRVSAQPFLRPAFDANVGRAQRIIESIMASGLKAAVARK